jgi:hypothetical protein
VTRGLPGDPEAGSHPLRPSSTWQARLRAKLGLAPNYHAAVVQALRIDDRPLRAAYARVAHTTVADMRDRLAEPGDHDTLAWPTFEAYRQFVMSSQRHSRARDQRLLSKRQASTLECGWRFAGLDFAEVITRERDGRVEQVEFIIEPGSSGAGYLVRIDHA